MNTFWKINPVSLAVVIEAAVSTNKSHVGRIVHYDNFGVVALLGLKRRAVHFSNFLARFSDSCS